MELSRTTLKLKAIDDVFALDCYQCLILLFNEALIFTMLSNLVFNIFGTSHVQLVGCDGSIFNGTTEENCRIFDSGCNETILRYEFYSANVEFEELCSQGRHTWLGRILSIIGIESKARFSTTTQMIGLVIGSAISGQLSDLYGRKKVTLILLIGILFASTLSSLSPSMDVYVCIRMVIGMFCGGLTTVGTILVLENLPTRHRLWMCTVVTWAPNYILFAVIAYTTSTWRLLTLACNVVTAVAVILLAIGMPETPKFLVQKRRKAEAIAAILYINSFSGGNNKFSEDEIELMVDNAIAMTGVAENRSKKKYTLLHLYSTTSFSIRTLVLSFGMFTVSYVTYGLLFNLHVIEGSIYWNTAICGVLRWLVGATVATVDYVGGKFVGRRSLHVFTMATVAVCMISTFLIEILGKTLELANLVRFLTLFAFGITGCIFLQFVLVTAELYPTAIRNLANSHFKVCGRMGSIFGPLAFSLQFVLAGFPYLLMGILCVADIILFQLAIPETKGRPLPCEMPKKLQRRSEKPNAMSTAPQKN